MTEPSKLAEALAKAQGEIKNAAFNRTNPHFKSKYADLASIRDAVTPTLAKHGLAVTQTTEINGDKFVLVTRLMHSGGEVVLGTYPLPLATDKPQIMGSAISYARRYTLAGIIGIASEDDDDAEGAEGRSGNGNTARTVTASKGTPKAENVNTPEGDTLVSEIVACTTAADLSKWGNGADVKAAIAKLPQAEQDRVRRAWADRSTALKEAA